MSHGHWRIQREITERKPSATIAGGEMIWGVFSSGILWAHSSLWKARWINTSTHPSLVLCKLNCYKSNREFVRPSRSGYSRYGFSTTTLLLLGGVGLPESKFNLTSPP
ncbi:hypothetical protein TNCV_3051861 [Trichonephila clavipes]|nr:hypothetical protein TNCV_3051861 [Trichonephila clavipes]